MKDWTTKALFSLDETLAKPLLEQYEYPWEALPHIAAFIEKLGPALPADEYEARENNVWVAKSATVAPTAFIGNNVIIGKNAVVAHCAYVRTNALIGEGAEVGNSSELKNVILFNNVHVPHYNYVGDSILGYKAHMGAGAITSNLKGDKTNIVVKTPEGGIATGLRKFGAILGDQAEIGCGTVLNPGSVVGRESQVYPLSMVRGVVPARSIYKKQGEVVEKQ